MISTKKQKNGGSRKNSSHQKLWAATLTPTTKSRPVPKTTGNAGRGKKKKPRRTIQSIKDLG